jgi:hypothetical protein
VLGKNNVYREAILGAAKRLGLIPQAICALIDCEAAKLPEHIALLGKDGKPLKDKKGKARTRTVYEVWKADSHNDSGAAGLTQFMPATWLDHVMRPGYYIHDESQKAGWVRLVDVPKHGKQWMFVLADGKTITEAHKGHLGDDNVKKCLAMRMDPTWAVNAAADYGNANLKLLKAKGFKLDGLADMDKAKLMYLMHHEGPSAGPAFISDTLAPTAAAKVVLRSKFVEQVGAKQVEKALDDAGDDVEVAYRFWLAGYINDKFFSASQFFCSEPRTGNLLTDLLEQVGGKGITKP